MITCGDLYASLVQLRIHADSITWNRFYNFLMFNTILVLAWTSVYAADPTPRCARGVLISFCLFGALSGIAWAVLGYRGRRFLSELMELCKKAEADSRIWPEYLDDHKPATLELHLRETLTCPSFGSFYLLVVGPLLFTLLYVVLAAITIT